MHVSEMEKSGDECNRSYPKVGKHMHASLHYCPYPTKQPKFQIKVVVTCVEREQRKLSSLSRLVHREHENIKIASKISLSRKKNYKRKHHPHMHIGNITIVAHRW